jgi:hypothetical protein
MSRNAQDKLSFHQSILSKRDKKIVIDFLESEASHNGKNILARYIPSIGSICKKTLPERFLMSILAHLKSNSTIQQHFKNCGSRRFKS